MLLDTVAEFPPSTSVEVANVYKRRYTPRQGLDIEVTGYKYERMRQKEETNLGAVVSEGQAGTGEPGPDDTPEPEHRRTKRDVGGIY